MKHAVRRTGNTHPQREIPATVFFCAGSGGKAQQQHDVRQKLERQRFGRAKTTMAVNILTAPKRITDYLMQRIVNAPKKLSESPFGCVIPFEYANAEEGATLPDPGNGPVRLPAGCPAGLPFPNSHRVYGKRRD